MGIKEEILIENIEEKDIDEIVRLGLSTKELWPTDKPSYFSKEDLKSFIKSPNDIYLVARVNREIAGYRLANYNPYLKEAYLIDIVVKEKYRGLGIGALLYKRTLEELKKRGCGWVWAIVHEDNNKMMRFMEKQGFTKGRKFYFYHKGIAK